MLAAGVLAAGVRGGFGEFGLEAGALLEERGPRAGVHVVLPGLPGLRPGMTVDAKPEVLR